MQAKGEQAHIMVFTFGPNRLAETLPPFLQISECARTTALATEVTL